jgi:hypothetical protein
MKLDSSQRNQIASYKITIEGYRRDLDRLKEEKKRQSEYYARMIKSASTQDSKRSYRQTKISTINGINNRIESKKRQIDQYKTYIKNIRS